MFEKTRLISIIMTNRLVMLRKQALFVRRGKQEPQMNFSDVMAGCLRL